MTVITRRCVTHQFQVATFKVKVTLGQGYREKQISFQAIVLLFLVGFKFLGDTKFNDCT